MKQAKVDELIKAYQDMVRQLYGEDILQASVIRQNERNKNLVEIGLARKEKDGHLNRTFAFFPRDYAISMLPVMIANLQLRIAMNLAEEERQKKREDENERSAAIQPE